MIILETYLVHVVELSKGSVVYYIVLYCRNPTDETPTYTGGVNKKALDRIASRSRKKDSGLYVSSANAEKRCAYLCYKVKYFLSSSEYLDSVYFYL